MDVRKTRATIVAAGIAVVLGAQVGSVPDPGAHEPSYQTAGVPQGSEAAPPRADAPWASVASDTAEVGTSAPQGGDERYADD